MNKLAGIMVAILIGLGMMISPNAQEIIKLQTPPAVIDGTLMGPVKEVASLLGAEVSWNSETKATEIRKENLLIQLFPDTNRMIIGPKEIKLPRKIEFDRTGQILLAPIRPIVEGIGATISELAEPNRKQQTIGHLDLTYAPERKISIELPILPRRMFLNLGGQRIYRFEGDYLIDSAHCCTGATWKLGWYPGSKHKYHNVYYVDYLDGRGPKSRCTTDEYDVRTPYKVFLWPKDSGDVRMHAYHSLPARAASHGCWRLPYQFAKLTYYWVKHDMPIYVRLNRDFSLPGDPR